MEAKKNPKRTLGGIESIISDSGWVTNVSQYKSPSTFSKSNM